MASIWLLSIKTCRQKEHHKFVSDKRGCDAIRGEILKSLMTFLHERLDMPEVAGIKALEIKHWKLSPARQLTRNYGSVTHWYALTNSFTCLLTFIVLLLRFLNVHLLWVWGNLATCCPIYSLCWRFLTLNTTYSEFPWLEQLRVNRTTHMLNGSFHSTTCWRHRTGIDYGLHRERLLCCIKCIKLN